VLPYEIEDVVAESFDLGGAEPRYSRERIE